MDSAKHILEGLLALVFLASGGSKLVRATPVVANFRHLGVSLSLLPVLGTVEVLLAAGLALGFVAPLIGALAALGVIVFMIGAVSTHLALKDLGAGPVPAVILGLLALALTLLTIPHVDRLFG